MKYQGLTSVESLEKYHDNPTQSEDLSHYKDIINVDLDGKDLTSMDFDDVLLKNVQFTGSKLKGATYNNYRALSTVIISDHVERITHEYEIIDSMERCESYKIDGYIFKVEITNLNPDNREGIVKTIDYIVHIGRYGKVIEDWGINVIPRVGWGHRGLWEDKKDEIIEYVSKQRDKDAKSEINTQLVSG